MSTPRVWLITGASSSFGRITTEKVLSNDRVVATIRKPDVLDDLKAQCLPSQLLVVQLDVTKNEEIKFTFLKAKETFGRLDVVFYNAWCGISAEVEETPEEDASLMFETNFWGATNVSREAVRFLREENKPAGGRLLVNSSRAGVRAIPAGGYYSASKHALEGVTEALARELDPAWNIMVTIIEPGYFQTHGAGKPTPITHPAYSKPSLAGNAFRRFVFQGRPIGRTQLEPFPIGADAIDVIKKEVKSIMEDTEKYEGWSEGLVFNDEKYPAQYA